MDQAEFSCIAGGNVKKNQHRIILKYPVFASYRGKHVFIKWARFLSKINKMYMHTLTKNISTRKNTIPWFIIDPNEKQSRCSDRWIGKEIIAYL